jgi:hypothetical protein
VVFALLAASPPIGYLLDIFEIRGNGSSSIITNFGQVFVGDTNIAAAIAASGTQVTTNGVNTYNRQSTNFFNGKVMIGPTTTFTSSECFLKLSGTNNATVFEINNSQSTESYISFQDNNTDRWYLHYQGSTGRTLCFEDTTGADWLCLNTNGSVYIPVPLVVGTNVFDATKGSLQVNTTNVMAQFPIRPLAVYRFAALDFDTPNNADWATNNAAIVEADTVNAAIFAAKFDGSSDEGVGGEMYIPVGATEVKVITAMRSQTVTNAAVNVQSFILSRTWTDQGAVSGWSTNTFFTAFAVQTNTQPKYFRQTFSIATMQMTTGTVWQFEFIRDGDNAADTLIGDGNVFHQTYEFY